MRGIKDQKIIFLGPQRLTATVGEVLDKLHIDGPIAVITAGWQERESEDQELQKALGRSVVNLHLHARADEVFSQDSQLFAGHRAKQDQLRRLQRLYRIRLRHELEAARKIYNLLHEASDPGFCALIAPEVEAALTSLRQLDRHHLLRVQALEQAFVTRFRPNHRVAVTQQLKQIEQCLEPCCAIAIAGGHVATLLTRLRLFGMKRHLVKRPLVAWSAGAMAICERVVLFHDFPPQGRGDPELLCSGLGLVPQIVALPHAKRRLRLDDHGRVALFARRFAPARCVALDDRSELYFNGPQLRTATASYALQAHGQLAPLELP